MLHNTVTSQSEDNHYNDHCAVMTMSLGHLRDRLVFRNTERLCYSNPACEHQLSRGELAVVHRSLYLYLIFGDKLPAFQHLDIAASQHTAWLDLWLSNIHIETAHRSGVTTGTWKLQNLCKSNRWPYMFTNLAPGVSQ